MALPQQGPDQEHHAAQGDGGHSDEKEQQSHPLGDPVDGVQDGGIAQGALRGGRLPQKVVRRHRQDLGHPPDVLRVRHGLSRLPLAHRLPCDPQGVRQGLLGESRLLPGLIDLFRQ